MPQSYHISSTFSTPVTGKLAIVGSFSKNGTIKVPQEVVKALYVEKSLHVLRTYAIITHHPEISGNLPERKIDMVAKILGKTQQTVIKHLKVMTELGLAMQHSTKNGNLWMAVGGDVASASMGKRSKCKTVVFPWNTISAKDLRAFAIAVFMTEQIGRKKFKARSKKANKTACKQERFNEMSASYTANYIRQRYGKTVSPQEVSSLRSHAAKKGWIGYERQQKSSRSHPLEAMEACDFSMTVFKRRDGSIGYELPAKFNFGLSVTVRPIPAKIKPLADRYWSLRGVA